MQTLQQLKNGELKGLTTLKLSGQLTSFPEEIFELADTLEYLDLSGNALRLLPSDFGRLQKLKIFFCSENQFTVLPEVLGDCPLLDIVGFKSNQIETVPAKAINPNLRWLILTNNRINELPAETGNCHRMQKLMLAGNRLKALPSSLANCKNLELLRIAANQLDELPQWLLSMPKLSWLAFSGNKFNHKHHVKPIDSIDWNELEIEQQIGEGASGIISKAVWNKQGIAKDVAVKIFKGAVTSDGLPQDEMDACIVAGNHEGLVKLIGEIANHPQNKKGLVMELIPEGFFNLGLPPSFASCTRDVFKPETTLSAARVLKIAATIASVTAHLHRNGIMHSDLYAHNILTDHNGNTLLSDFGAASFYDQDDRQISLALERLEVRAYGCLLDDLICLCTEKDNEAIKQLTKMKDRCLSEDIFNRPIFEYINKQLANLAE
ncbi:leucine rich repeat (LRR) protein [Mucilaginibacter oryzae]|uniref:Leucine rich repeat (LRR) protein n=1 Tax=Mucilaginibacter oryzae TaxID=468058 RepID=A0A316H7N1_9SPHI|nr:leucine-rich repeat-containing protein kinase family protein [Mucilaginibacter oryzae]PWK75991.1 leucine rich repeat (LRR) protein [Mucilaginibacter oryzae]